MAIPIAAIIAAAAAAKQLVGTSSQTLGSASDTTNLNQGNTDYINDLLSSLQGTSAQQASAYAGQASNSYSNMLNQGNTLMSQGQLTSGLGQNAVNSASGALSGVRSDLANMSGYDTSASTRLFQQNTPIYQDLAQDARSQALDSFEAPASTLAAFQSSNNVQSAANQFAGLGGAASGAAAAAAAEGALTPMTQLASDRAATGTSAYQSTLNPLLQQGMNQASNETQMAYQSQVNELVNQMSAAQAQGQLGASQLSAGNQAQSTGASMYGQGASGQAGLSSLYAGLQGSALSGLSQLGQAEYYSPTVTQGSGIMGMFG